MRNLVIENASNLINHDIKSLNGNASLEEKVKRSILMDLKHLNWDLESSLSSVIAIPPKYYDKESIRHAMSLKRDEIIELNRKWIDKKLILARSNLTSGIEAFYSRIIPEIEVCQTQKQHDLFRILRYSWASPYSEYVGRRIKIIIRDKALPSKPVIGIAALGSPIIHIPERDSYIGWDKNTRTKNLNYLMDAYVIGAVPPYNYILGGKLISYILASKEVRRVYEQKYANTISIISGRKLNKLVGLVTTSLYGKSSQYNRIKFNGELLYKPIGETKGFGSFHLSKRSINTMIDYLKANDQAIDNSFGRGPSWVMRVISRSGELLGLDSDILLNHSFKRHIYFIPYAKNALEFLNDETNRIQYTNYTMSQLTKYWKERWLYNRKENYHITEEMKWFQPEDFSI